jgi:hypothetical protein
VISESRPQLSWYLFHRCFVSEDHVSADTIRVFQLYRYSYSYSFTGVVGVSPEAARAWLFLSALKPPRFGFVPLAHRDGSLIRRIAASTAAVPTRAALSATS